MLLLLCAGLKFSYFFASTRFLIKKNVIVLLNVLQEIVWQVPTKTCLFKVAFVKYLLKMNQRSFSLCVNFLLTLILQSLTS